MMHDFATALPNPNINSGGSFVNPPCRSENKNKRQSNSPVSSSLQRGELQHNWVGAAENLAADTTTHWPLKYSFEFLFSIISLKSLGLP